MTRTRDSVLIMQIFAVIGVVLFGDTLRIPRSENAFIVQ